MEAYFRMLNKFLLRCFGGFIREAFGRFNRHALAVSFELGSLEGCFSLANIGNFLLKTLKVLSTSFKIHFQDIELLSKIGILAIPTRVVRSNLAGFSSEMKHKSLLSQSPAFPGSDRLARDSSERIYQTLQVDMCAEGYSLVIR